MPLMVWPVSPNMPCDGPRYDPYLVVAPDGSRACAVPRYREHLPNGVSYQTLDLGYSPEDDYPPVVVPDGHVFLMGDNRDDSRSEEHTSELQSLMRISYAVFCLKKKIQQ